ncbi:MAG: S-layer homology domain-containing protein [Acidimicrobiales bacterium]
MEPAVSVTHLSPSSLVALERSAAAVVLAVALLVGTPAPTAAFGGFGDVPSGEYYSEAVAWMASEGITVGTSPGCFSPHDLTTRGQAVAFLWRYEGSPGGHSHDFVDVEAAYQQEAVGWAQDTGVTTGVDATHFRPDDPVTRGEAVVFLWRLAGRPTDDIAAHDFVDVEATYQQDAVSWAEDTGVTTGTSATTFEPDRVVTRAELATFLWRYDGRTRVSSPPDEDCGGTGGGTDGGGTSGVPASTVALGLTPANTGVVGGQSAGVCAASLTPMSGRIVLDDQWVDDHGGSRVFENFDLDGSMVITADDITVRCGRASGNDMYTIENRAFGTVFEWIEAGQDDNGKTIMGGNYEAYRCDVWGGEDSIHVNTGTTTITECYIHDQNHIGDDPHPDAIQATSGGTVDSLTVVRSKLISLYKDPNAALQINIASTWSITDSYLWGGLYTILGDPYDPGTVVNNYFGWDSSRWGAIGGVTATQSGNVWWEWLSPRCEGPYSAPSCSTPADHPGNGTPVLSE